MQRRGMKRVRRNHSVSVGYKIEQLEQRQLLAWDPLGPFSASDGQVENISPDNEVVGAAHVAIAHPTNVDVLYVGGTNGGIWRTDNATATNPTWVPLTDGLPSSSIGALTFDVADTSGNTVYAGIGRFSSFGRTGGDRIGLIRTTDAGATWEVVDGGGMLTGMNISGLHVNGSNIVVSVNTADNFTDTNVGIFRSTDGGATFTQVSTGDGTATGLPAGVSFDLFADPTDPTIIYTASVYSAALGGGQVGVYKSIDSGASWNKVSNATMDALIDNATTQQTGTSNLEIAVGRANNVYVSIINGGAVAGLFRSGDGGTNWTQMETPTTNENGTDVGLNPGGGKGPTAGSAPSELAGGQGSIHFSMVADPNNANIVYVGGDRQPLEFQNPTSVGGTQFSGRLFRGDASQAIGSQWVHLTHSNSLGPAGGGTASSSSPHADSRDMVFDAAGNIIEVDDGGIYRRTQPTSNQGDWFSINGNLQITEAHDVAYDAVSGLGITGNQDTGTTAQVQNQSLWVSISTADGGDVVVDDVSLAGQGQSIWYSSFQNLGGFARRVVDAAGNIVTTDFPALTLNSGTAFQGAFRTPVELNRVNPQKLIIQGNSGVYESADQGDSIDEVTVAGGVDGSNGGIGQNAIVAGGYLDGNAEENVLWVGAGSSVLLRDQAGTQLVETTSPGLGTIRDLAVDPDDWQSAFVIDSGNISMTDDSGNTWADITGDLMSSVSSLWSVSYIASAAADAVVVGTNLGVYMSLVDSLGTWVPLSTGLPNAIVYDMEMDIAANSLVVGTLGRGAWILPNATGVINGDDDNNNNNNNGNGNNVTVLDSCGVALPDGTTSFSGAIGGNFFASNHAILDGTEPGQLGYDDAILDFLRGNGTTTEIPKAEYSIAVLGNGGAAWSFSNGTQEATGYERTDYYDINFVDPSVFEELIAHDLIIVLSSDSAVTGGLTSAEMTQWATVQDNIATAVNERGLDLWVGASGGDTTYHNFLPTGILTTVAEAGVDPLDGYEVTVEGQLLGITEAMVDSADATYYYSAIDDDLATVERRFLGESTSVAATNIAFYNDEMVPAADVPGGTTQGMVGFAYQDLNMDGFHDPIEMGVAGARFFIDYNDDGYIGLCEPTATSNAAGQFIIRSAYSGTFRILPVPTAGAVVTSTTPVYVTIATDGSATLSAPLEFGVIAGSDSGNYGLGGTVPVAQGAYLGVSPVLDDGVFFGNGIKKGLNTVTINSSVEHNNVVMNAWIDLNKDGDFNDANERIFTNIKLTPGLNNYNFTIPQTVFDDSVLPDAARLAANMRFRVGPTLNVGPTADDHFGEIEDYKVFITQDADTGLVAVDDVFTYQEDTDGQSFNVLANDSSFFNRSLTIVPGSVTNITPVETPPLDIYVSSDGKRIIFDAAGVMDLTEDITFEYTVQDSAGVMETATVTLVAPIDPLAVTTTPNLLSFNNSGFAADVNDDGSLTNLDYVMILKELRTTGSRALPNFGSGSATFNMFIDINGDGRFSALDLLKLSDILATYSSQGEPLEQEPVSNDSVEMLSATPVVEVAAPLSKTEDSAPTAPAPQTYSSFQIVASDLLIDSESGESNVAEVEVIPAEAATELAFSSLGGDQSDLLWSDSDELEFAPSEGEVEDDVFADPEWDSELLSY